jgi:hypothetical protein
MAVRTIWIVVTGAGRKRFEEAGRRCRLSFDEVVELLGVWLMKERRGYV